MSSRPPGRGGKRPHPQRGRGGSRHRGSNTRQQVRARDHEILPSGARNQQQPVKGESRRGGRGPRKHQVDKSTGGASQHHQIRYLTQTDIEKLAESDSETIVQCIDENEPGFLAAYEHHNFCTHPLLLKHLVMMLYKLAKANDSNISSRVLAQILSASGKYTLFITQLRMLIAKIPSETRTHIKRENPQYLHYIIEIGLFAVERIPRTVAYVYPVEAIKGTVDSLVRNGEHNSDTLVLRVEQLMGEFESARTEQQPSHEQQEDSDSNARPEPGPPEHFTELPVLPEVDDVQPFAPEPYLRPNRVKKGYDDWDHYLDVQFRLLREDFVEPLRKGITQHYEGKKLSDVRVYEQVSVLQPVCLYSGMGFQIRFDVTKLKRVNWEHTKRLIYGSLLCLSRDDFQTVFFATVVKREAKLLENGLLTIKFEDETNGFQIDPTIVYTMVESNAYFEAYRHVLTGLQNASKNGQTDILPFKQYIVHVQLQDIPMPSYLRSAVFSLTDTIALNDVKSSTATLSHITLTADCSKWPPCELTCLDPSQYEAFKTAVTQEISVIQGPPGTGKTYIGVKIVEAFLKNRNVWDKYKTSPVCVLCYTNHALDQFLEEIKKTKIDGKEPNIIRIGGRCKTESLKSCVLREKVDAVREQRALPVRLHKRLASALYRLRTIKEDINLFQESLDISGNKILSLSILERFVDKDHLNQLINGMPTDPGKEVDVWLGLWYAQYSNEEPLSSTEPLDSVSTAQSQASIPLEEVVSDDDLIEVDAEARLLEEDRILEGEELELEPQTLANYSQHTLEESELVPQQSQDGWKTVQISDSKRRRLIQEGYTQKPMKIHEVRQIHDIWSLRKKQRWKLYKFWENTFVKHQKAQLVTLGQQYNEACEWYSKCQREIYSHVMLGADVIGITTTGAAKHQEILQEIYPKILVIEEAAEVFEAHIVSSLRSSVRQLIMIGDHKQLRPKPNCYKIGEEYGLNVSLFERLAMNGLNVLSLGVQHRMKPEIADLIRPCIYSNLSDHEEDTKHDSILGIGKNLFAIDHKVPEERNDANDLRSHSNFHEAEYLVALCKYLLNQEYKPSQITLLTMYRGQLLELRRRMKRKDFQGVRVAAVDDFQGEENDIILLSLVRSNSDGIVGFLKVENRVCVSLSRAKKGLYIIGNFSMLRDKHDSIWPQILTTLEQKQCIGNALPLYCQLHPNQQVAAQRPQDFLKCPEGGCQQPCATRLQCGHTCPRLCHPYDRKHEKYKCKKQCIMLLSCGHQCLSRCHQCTDGCQPCFERVERTIPRCGHVVTMACSVDPTTVECPMLCDKQLLCGHMCQELCSKPCTVMCHVKTEKILHCGHKMKDYCFTDPKSILCQVNCDAKLDCLHTCSGTCGMCHRGRLHIRCQSECGRTLVCGHLCEFPCTPNCPPCLQKCKNYCVHSKCPKRCYELCSPCMEACKWKCEHFQCTRPCGEKCNRPPCKFPCKERLKCEHPCIGLCGETCPKQCRICNKDEVCEIFFGTEDEPGARFIQLHDCGHIFEVNGLDKWIDYENKDAPQVVQFKLCPKCKTEVRRSLRYGNTIKRTLLDHEAIKKKQLESCSTDLNQQFKDVYSKARKSPCYSVIAEELKSIESDIRPPNKSTPKLFPHRVNAIVTQLTLLPHVLEISEQLSSLKGQCSFSSCLIKPEDIRHDLQTVLAFFMQELPLDQQVSDAQCEIRRISCITKLCDLSTKLADRNIKLEPKEKFKLETMVNDVHYSGLTAEKLSDGQESEVCEFIAHMSEKYEVNGLSKKQRMAIVKAIGLGKGHWYKCPNGHFYCIADCGGATVEAKCPECGATIGGHSHTLAAGNAHAPEMDDSQYPAWSERANLQNYDPQQFAHVFQ